MAVNDGYVPHIPYQYDGQPCHPALWSDDDRIWIRRERRKQRNRPIPPLPMGLEDRYPEHCVHLSADVDGMVVYTPDWLYGRQDRQVRVKPGRYLAKFYPEIPAHVTSEWVHACAPKTLTISQDADVIADVYYYGPPSCQHPNSSHSNEYTRDWANHPVRMYAGPDLAIAYLGDQKAAIARAIVWPEKKTYSTVYGEPSLGDRLEALGYTSRHPYGAKCRARWDGDRLIVPYVDGIGSCSVRGGLVILDSDGEYDCQNTHGYAEEASRNTCANCETSIDHDETYCSSCEEDRWTCESCGDVDFNTDNMYSTDNVTYCETCYNDRVARCELCDDTFEDNSRRRSVQRDYSDRDVRALCDGCADEHRRCADCNAYTDYPGPVQCVDCRPPVTVVLGTYRGGTLAELLAQVPLCPTSATVPSVPEVAPPLVPPVPFMVGQTVALQPHRGLSAAPGQLGTVTGIDRDFVHVTWDRRSGTTQCDGGYRPESLRIATTDDVRAYETAVTR